MCFFLALAMLFISPLLGGALNDAIVAETESIDSCHDPVECASHYLERGEYYFICEYYQSASEDILNALNLIEEEKLHFRGFITLGMIFANLQMDDQYFATLEHLKTLLRTKHCSRCHIFHLPATQLEPQIRTVTNAFLAYAFSPMAQFSIAFFIESLEHSAYHCPHSIPLWEQAIKPLATKLHQWKDYEYEQAEWNEEIEL